MVCQRVAHTSQELVAAQREHLWKQSAAEEAMQHAAASDEQSYQSATRAHEQMQAAASADKQAQELVTAEGIARITHQAMVHRAPGADLAAERLEVELEQAQNECDVLAGQELSRQLREAHQAASKQLSQQQAAETAVMAAEAASKQAAENSIEKHSVRKKGEEFAMRAAAVARECHARHEAAVQEATEAAQRLAVLQQQWEECKRVETEHSAESAAERADRERAESSAELQMPAEVSTLRLLLPSVL